MNTTPSYQSEDSEFAFLFLFLILVQHLLNWLRIANEQLESVWIPFNLLKQQLSAYIHPIYQLRTDDSEFVSQIGLFLIVSHDSRLRIATGPTAVCAPAFPVSYPSCPLGWHAALARHSEIYRPYSGQSRITELGTTLRKRPTESSHC